MTGSGVQCASIHETPGSSSSTGSNSSTVVIVVVVVMSASVSLGPIPLGVAH
jgi:hypothetical protein